MQPETDRPLAANAAHTIRLLLVDTPETVHPSQPVACYGPQASEFVTDQLLGETVWLEADVQDTDRYGRFLRHVWLDEGTNFNLELVEQGYADAVLYEPNDQYWEEFAAAETARAHNVGLWGACESFSAPPHRRRHRPRPGGRHGRGARVRLGLRRGLPDGVHPTAAPGPRLWADHRSLRGATTPSDPHRLDGNSDGLGCES